MTQATNFPGITQRAMRYEMKVRKRAELQDADKRLKTYQWFARLWPGLTPFSAKRKNDVVEVTQQGKKFLFPFPVPLIKHSHIAFGYRRLISNKYRLPGVVEVEPGDCVVDCGGYVGGFSMDNAEIAGQIHIFEPHPANVDCIQRNFAAYPSVHVHQCGLFDKSGTLPLNVSSSSVEHSFLAPDDGEALGKIEVPIYTLAEMAKKLNLPQIDFCKVEAEGVEPEVIFGLGNLRPRKVAVDVSPERDGSSPREPIEAWLTERGYECFYRAPCLFARLKE